MKSIMITAGKNSYIRIYVIDRLLKISQPLFALYTLNLYF